MRQENMRRLISVASLVIIMLVFGLTSNSFFTAGNILSILRECAVTGIIAIGVTFVIITAGQPLDLQVCFVLICCITISYLQD